MNSQAGQQIITIQILENFSISKSNQAIKFGLQGHFFQFEIVIDFLVRTKVNRDHNEEYHQVIFLIFSFEETLRKLLKLLWFPYLCELRGNRVNNGQVPYYRW